jgi:hypothetical protein
MGSKVEKLEVALAQNTPFEDEVVELAPKFISAEAREKALTASPSSPSRRRARSLRRTASLR